MHKSLHPHRIHSCMECVAGALQSLQGCRNQGVTRQGLTRAHTCAQQQQQHQQGWAMHTRLPNTPNIYVRCRRSCMLARYSQHHTLRGLTGYVWCRVYNDRVCWRLTGRTGAEPTVSHGRDHAGIVFNILTAYLVAPAMAGPRSASATRQMPPSPASTKHRHSGQLQQRCDSGAALVP